MPEFVLNRNYTLQGGGHCINFLKGQPISVPNNLVKEAAAIGAERVDGVDVDPLDPEASAPIALTAEQRLNELVAAIEMICEKNDSSDFGGDNRPTLDALHKVISFTTTKRELTSAWNEYKAKQV